MNNLEKKILRCWDLATMCGHFCSYTVEEKLGMNIGEIAVCLQTYGFNGNECRKAHILNCIERCRKLLGCKRPLTESGKARALKDFALALADKVLDVHYALGGDSWTEEDDDGNSMKRYYYWSDRPATVAKMAVARFMLGEA